MQDYHLRYLLRAIAICYLAGPISDSVLHKLKIWTANPHRIGPKAHLNQEAGNTQHLWGDHEVLSAVPCVFYLLRRALFASFGFTLVISGFGLFKSVFRLILSTLS